MGLESMAFRRVVDAPLAEIMRAFTRATALREWLCDVASADARRGGRLYLYWNHGYYAAGDYTRIEPDWCCAFTWQGRDEPAPTQVAVTLEPLNQGVEVCLTHSELSGGVAWAKARDQISRGWETGLENLQSVLETGQDLRWTRRPVLGAELDELDAEVAARLGVAPTQGLRVIAVTEGTGAQKAGLQPDDVVVTLGSRPLRNYAEFIAALDPWHGGDTAPVQFYRGGHAQVANLTLGSRRVPALPASPQDLAERARTAYGPTAELADLVGGAGPDLLNCRPGPGEWSPLEIVAHLVICERELQAWISDVVNDDERTSDAGSNPTNGAERIAAAVSAYPTGAGMLDAWQRSIAESMALLESLPPAFTAHRGAFWRLGRDISGWAGHASGHVKQVKAVLEAARRG